ncbi:hypothetical protein M9137_001942, partial [Campylobacter coli]|nr:hypothetical protein [Campylobacter coli]
ESLGSSSGTQLIATAFTFGGSALVFSTLPFAFVLVNGILKAKNSNNSGSILSVFLFAFFIHFMSCSFFMLGIKLLDILNAIYEPNYIQNKVFPIFWAKSESEVFALAGAKGTIEDKGAYFQLFIVQRITYWFSIASIWIVFLTASSYGAIEARKDTMQSNFITYFIWILISNIIAFFVFFLWAKIASLALFIPNGEDFLNKIYEAYKNISQR